jgi:chromosome segregation ATPase
MKQILKSSMGGYTKQSVLDYLAVMRKNQQNMAETFYENQQILYVEKEKIRLENEKLKSKLADLDAKYLDLTTEVNAPRDEVNEAHAHEIARLTSNIDALQNLVNSLNNTIASLKEENLNLLGEIQSAAAAPAPADGVSVSDDALAEIKNQMVSLELALQEANMRQETLAVENAELASKLELATQEAETRKALLISNDTDSEQQKTRLAEMAAFVDSQAQTLQEERTRWETERAVYERQRRQLEEELTYAKQSNANRAMSMGNTQDIDLMMKVNELTEQLALQSELIASENAERTIREETIRSLSAQIEALKTDSASFKASIENLSLQNEKLLLANSTLITRMEEDCKKTTALINEKSDISIEKLMTMKKLSEAETRIAMLEMELSRYR